MSKIQDELYRATIDKTIAFVLGAEVNFQMQIFLNLWK
jgi:hypothetical protein